MALYVVSASSKVKCTIELVGAGNTPDDHPTYICLIRSICLHKSQVYNRVSWSREYTRWPSYLRIHLIVSASSKVKYVNEVFHGDYTPVDHPTSYSICLQQYINIVSAYDQRCSSPSITFLHLVTWQFLTATLKCTCNDSFTDLLRVVSVSWL